MKQNLDILKERLLEITHLSSAYAVLGWDEQVYMPSKSASSRSQASAFLAGLIHDKSIHLDDNGVLSALKKELDAGNLNESEAVIVRETWRGYEKQVKLPKEFVEQFAQATSLGVSIWQEARKMNSFGHFEAQLTKIFDLARQEAGYLGYKESAYDALLDQFEPDMTAAKIAPVFNELKTFLVPFIAKLTQSTDKPDATRIAGNFSETKQHKLSLDIARAIGFDFETGRLDKSAHPFTTSFHPHDVRITTRFDKHDILPAFLATIHEGGHALYEQGLVPEYFGTPLSEAVSLGMHESQSMLWEKMVGRSKEFWQYMMPTLQKTFPQPFATLTFAECFGAVNAVQPTFIRVEADEVTYNLHVIIRFELEKQLLEGTLEVKDLPHAWNSKYKEYLGIDVPGDAQGVLQDVHWCSGAIGYFPTYTIGNLYAVQLFEAATKQIPDLNAKIARGEFSELREWLRQNIHKLGKMHSAEELIQKITGSTLSTKPFTKYIDKKYSEIYKLN